jgi:hypothetical protein
MRKLALVAAVAAVLAVPLAEAQPSVVPYAGFYDCRAPT